MRRVHVVILTAITLEYRATRQVDAGAWERSQWEEERGPNGLPVAFRTFHGKGGRPLRVAVAQAGDMGGIAATNALLPLVEAYQPQCVAMCGVCAGRPGKTNLGDVITADRLFLHDSGKRLPKEVQQDLKTYNLRDDWKVAIDHLDFAARFRNEEWWKKRPIPYEWQENWVLAMLHQGIADPSSLPECDVFCPQWEKVIEQLWALGYLQHGTLILTDKGRKRIGPLLIKHRNRFPDISPTGPVLPFRVHVAPMGSGNQVVEDKTVWGFISEPMRKTLGLEMEAASVGALTHAQRDRRLDAVVMKGVMDFANNGRDDHFKDFAARASAECLIAFLRDQLDVEAVHGIDDLLVSGAEQKLPEIPPPSALLSAGYEVVPFHEQGRESILAELDRWCDGDQLVTVRLLHAKGGFGKTRLAIEWIRRRRALGWAAGFLQKEVPEDWFERLWALGQQVLVVIDYAEGRSDLHTALLRVHRYSQQKGASAHRRMRILLIARNSGEWWQSLQQSDAALGAWLGATPPHELTPLATHIGERERVFHEAAKSFAEKRGKTYQLQTSVLLTDRRFEQVLYLHMAALAVVEGLAFKADTLTEVVLDHEEHFWEIRFRLDAVTHPFQRSIARQLVAAAILRGGFEDADTAERAAKRIFGSPLPPLCRVLLWLLHRIYEGTGKGPFAFLPALEPDLLAEALVLRVASQKLEKDHLPSDWIDRVLPIDEGTTAVGTGLVVLGHASAVQPDVVRPWIERLLAGPLRPRGRLALQAAKAVGLRTALSVLGDTLAAQLEARGDIHLARELEAVGIPRSTVSLRRVAEWISRTLLQGLSASEEEGVLAERARLQNNLSNRLSELGRREEALSAIKKAVELYRVLAQRNPDAIQPDLAASLNNSSKMLSEVGQRTEALKPIKEAIELYRRLAQRNPDAFQPDLAISLSNLGGLLITLGQREEALAATAEAVELYRRLAQRNPDASHPYLAMSLNNLGNTLSSLGRREEALKSTAEGVELYRALAQRNPDAFQPDLAMSLSNLGNKLSGLGRREEALKVTGEAVELYRTLAQRNPDAFQPDLATSLSNLGNRFSGLGRREEALKVTEEAVELHRMLAQRNPDAFQPDLAMSLNNLGNRFSDLGRREEALKVTEEAFELHRMLAQRNPDAFQPDLAMSLNNLGNRLSDLGRREEALKAAGEAVELYRSLAQRNPDAFQHDLAMSLNNLGIRLSEVGKLEEALSATKEATELYRALAQRNPDAFQPDLAMSLNNLGNVWSEMGRREEALRVTEEAIELYQGLAHRNPDAFLPSLAMSLNNLGGIFSELSRREDALKAMGKAIEHYLQLAQRSPNTFLPDLVSSLNNLESWWGGLDHHKETLRFAREAISAYHQFAESNPESAKSKLAKSFRSLASTLATSISRGHELKATYGAFSLYPKHTPTNPFRPGSPLINEGDLVGRAPLIEEILALVSNRSPTILIGPRRSGKTWLLRLLERRIRPHRPVRYVTLEGKQIQSADDLALVLEPALDSAKSQGKGRRQKRAQRSSERFRARFLSDQSPVFLIDEVAHLYKADSTLFPWLRALGQEFASIVLAGSPLDWVRIVSRAAEVAPGSSFGNDVTPVVLSSISKEDAIRFMVETSRGEIPEHAAMWVVETCGPWPFYLQVMGHALVESSRAGQRKPFNQVSALHLLYEQRLLVDRRPVFEGRWQELPREVRTVLLAHPDERPELLSLPMRERRMLVDAGLCTSVGTWLADPPFFDWIQLNAAVLDNSQEER